MAKTALVTPLITPLVYPDREFASSLLALLDKAKFPISAALWLKKPEHDEWNLVIGTPLYEREGFQKTFLRLRSVLEKAEGRPVPLSGLPLQLRGNRDPFIRDLRKLLAKSEHVEGNRLGGQTLGGQYIQDAYVYRVR
jgi:hypothetical protein